MALNDWYEVLDRSVAGTVNVFNVYHVQRVDAAIRANTVLEAFEDRILTALLPLQDDSVTHTLLEARNLGDATDFNTRVPSPAVGTRVGEPFNSFTAAAIQFNRTRTDMKNGQKRWQVGVETDGDGNNWVPPFLTTLETIRDPMLARWFTDALPAVGVCDYGIIQRVCTVQPPPTPCPSYRLPETDLELQFFIPTTAIIRSVVRSQVSRKRANP